ncbi:twin-arginine translocation pathway signal protein [Cohaesibacter sp. CAU 1516]|uniref:twin-arginine translocation pathway signal protein n=1 Tax=Cohaesibacter sp. CAU 1516 TaxID=2576038 RepID=UPI0010FEA5F4|nr:twin-arginine translocation pathway signal protein [Cohaesibacter sp. CAU 1516]TLP44226.1 twin-arginine translocation pathway signal protein [Cohaesibacter sp. CAU 1516]
MNRRTLLTSAALAPVALALSSLAASAKMVTPWEWTRKNGVTGHMQKDPDPTDKEFEKYPRCTYCGMVREQWSHSRHLIQYDDDSTEGTCSIHCASLSIGLNMDRAPKNIWVGDAGSDAEVKPLIKVEDAHYALDPSKPGTMSATRKWAYADPAKAAAVGAERVVPFEQALEAAYSDMAKNTLMIRKRRAEKRAHMAKKMKMMKDKAN